MNEIRWYDWNSNLMEKPETYLDPIAADALCAAAEDGTVRIPEQYTKVGHYAFDSIEGLRRVIIPAHITDVEESAFLNCPDLTEVVFESADTQLGGDIFEDCPAAKVYLEK